VSVSRQVARTLDRDRNGVATHMGGYTALNGGCTAQIFIACGCRRSGSSVVTLFGV